MSRYLDPTTDFGFKKLFGEEANKDIIMSFITDVLELEAPLLDLNFLDKEQLPEADDDRSGVFDLYCKDVEGNRFIVEMQKNRIAFVNDRMLYYATFPIAAQAKKGRFDTHAFSPPASSRVSDVRVEYETRASASTIWNFELKAVYCIAILGYALDGSTRAVNRSSLRNDEPPHELFYDKLRFVTIELPLYDERKPEYSLDIHLNKWLYFLKYLPDLDRMPEIFKEEVVFQKAFRLAELAKLTSKERRHYEHNVKRMLDSYAVLETSYLRGKSAGKIEGRMEGKLEGKRESLLLLLSQKLGQVPPEIETMINSINEVEQLDAILSMLSRFDNWESVRESLSSLLQ